MWNWPWSDEDIDIQKGDMGGGSVPGEVDRIVTVELFQESNEGVRPMEPEKEYIIDKPNAEFYQ